jgi:type II secretory pathway pseudopilin PulG
MNLLEILITLILIGYLLAPSMATYLSATKRQVSQQIVASLKSLDVALLDINAQLHVVNPDYKIPISTSLPLSDPRLAVCASTPYRYKNIEPYKDLIDKGYLLLNYLDPRGNYFQLFKKYNAYLKWNGSTLYAICLNIPDEILKNQVKNGLDPSLTFTEGSALCYKLNMGAGYETTTASYSCP